jgi:hypothetical protein
MGMVDAGVLAQQMTAADKIDVGLMTAICGHDLIAQTARSILHLPTHRDDAPRRNRRRLS